MKIEILPTGPLSTNCYLVYLEDKRTLYIIDPGADPENIVAHAKKYDAEKCAILLTHAHADHIGAAGKVAKELNVTQMTVPTTTFSPITAGRRTVLQQVSLIRREILKSAVCPVTVPGARVFFSDTMENPLFSQATVFLKAPSAEPICGAETLTF